MGSPRARLTASLAVVWSTERASMLSLERLSARAREAPLRDRLVLLSTGCETHASRVLERLLALGGAPLPVPSERGMVELPLEIALREEAKMARELAERYQALAGLSRKLFDASAAWVCELNRTEELARAVETQCLSLAVASAGGAIAVHSH
jgi:hypothetical protein